MTAPAKVTVKWRPGLGLVVQSVLLAVALLPVLTVLWFTVSAPGAQKIEPAEIGALAAGLLVTLLVGYVLTRTVTAPIHELIRRVDEITREGRPAIRPLESYGTREVAGLTQSFLDMAGRFVEHSDYVRSFATHVSHELKSPLTSIRAAAELLLDDSENEPMSKEQRDRFLSNIVHDAERLDLLLVRLRELAKAEIASPGGETRIGDIAERLGIWFPDLTITVAGDTGATIALSGEAADIVFSNLARNAQQHGAQSFQIRATREGDRLEILIQDDGSGISEGDRARIFQPFFSTRRQEGGTGAGLGIVRSMLTTHGGSIRLGDTNIPGAAFILSVRIAG